MRPIRKGNRTGDILDKNTKVNALGEFKESKKKELPPIEKKSSFRPIREPKINPMGLIESPDYLKAETLEIPFPQVISEPESNNTQLHPIAPDSTHLHPFAPDNTPSHLIAPKDTHLHPRTPDHTQLHPTAPLSEKESFPFDPDNMVFLCLDGHAKKIIEILIEHEADKKPAIVSSDELRSKTGIASNHLSSLIFKMKKRGFIKTRSFYGKRIYEVNPSIFK